MNCLQGKKLCERMWNNNEVKTENFQKLVVGCCQKVKHCNLLGDKNLSVLHFSSSMSPCQLNVDYVSVWTSVSFSSVQKSKYNYYSSINQVSLKYFTKRAGLSIQRSICCLISAWCFCSSSQLTISILLKLLRVQRWPVM